MLERLSFLFRWKVATTKRHSCSDMLIRDQNPTATQIAHFSFLRPLPWVSTNLSSVHHQFPHLRLGLGGALSASSSQENKKPCPCAAFPMSVAIIPSLKARIPSFIQDGSGPQSSKAICPKSRDRRRDPGPKPGFLGPSSWLTRD